MKIISEKEVKKLIDQGLRAMNIALKDEQLERLLAYLVTFHQWNQVYNLSAIRDPHAMVILHLLDSLALLPYLREFAQHNLERVRLVDVGSGGGLPGLPLAIACPEVSVTLLDSNGKKARFLFQTALKLGLSNVRVIHNRIEKFSPEQKFAIVTSRAFANLQHMVRVSTHLLEEDGEFWAMKGDYPKSELAECGVNLHRAHRLQIPGCQAKRHLLILKKHSINVE